MPPLATSARSMMPAEPELRSVPPAVPAPEPEPKVMPPLATSARSMMPTEPCVKRVPVSLCACALSCAWVHSRLFAVAYLFLPKVGTSMPLAWHSPPRESRHARTFFTLVPS